MPIGQTRGLSPATVQRARMGIQEVQRVMPPQVKTYGYIPSALPDSKCYGGSGARSPSDVTKALANVFSTSEAPQLSGQAAATSPSSSAARPGVPGSLIGNSFRPSPSYVADTAEALQGVAGISAAVEPRSGTAATEAGPKVVHQPTPVPKQGA